MILESNGIVTKYWKEVAYAIRSNSGIRAEHEETDHGCKRVKDQLNNLRYSVDDKEIEMNALQVHNDNAKIEGEEKLITNTKNLYKAQVNGLRGKAQLSARGGRLPLRNGCTLMPKRARTEAGC